MKAVITCTDIDCPERHGDACQHDLDGTRQNLIRDLGKVHPMAKSEIKRRIEKLIADELRHIRIVYDAMEIAGGQDDFEKPKRPYVTWRGWKMIRNVITDRLESITGSRQ